MGSPSAGRVHILREGGIPQMIFTTFLYFMGMFACGMVYDASEMEGKTSWALGLILWPFYIAITLVILLIRILITWKTKQ